MWVKQSEGDREMGSDITVTINGEKRVVGRVNNDRFITNREKRHVVKKYGGFGIAEKVFDKLYDKVERIMVYYHRQDGGEDVYIASPETWRDKGVVDSLGGFENQRFLSMKDFDRVVGQ